MTHQVVSSLVKAGGMLQFHLAKSSSTLFFKRHFTLKTIAFQKQSEDLNLLSGLTNYVNKELYSFEPPSKDKTSTLRDLLAECESPADVLALIGNMHSMGKLWNDELVYYLFRLVKLTRFNDIDYKKSCLADILNHENFHLLLYKVISTSPCMTTTNLVNCFNSNANLMVPISSFAISRSVEVMQQRINDFFPKDVAICHAGLNTYRFQTKSMFSLQNGLVLHLENIAEDESFFMRTILDGGLNTLAMLSRHYGATASPRVRKCLFDSLLDYVNRNKKDDAISNNDAVKVLTSLSGLRHYNKFLVSTSINSIQSNLGQLHAQQQASLRRSFQLLRISFTERQVALLKDKFSDPLQEFRLSA